MIRAVRTRRFRAARANAFAQPMPSAGRLVVLGAVLLPMAMPTPARADDPAPRISIGGAQLPSLRPSVTPSGFAAGAPGLPDAGASIQREAPGTHGTPPTHPNGSPQAAAPVAPPTSGWSEAEVRAAQVQCQRALAGTDAQFTYVVQAKSGACGTPAAIELSGFGKGLAISPPLIVNCEVAAALHTWMKTQVQPLARKHLGAQIIQINTMSSYACRNRYGAKNAPLSQHAFANAVDIRGFVTAKGQLLDVEQHWGPTEKELAAHRSANPTVVTAQATLPIAAAHAAPARSVNAPAGSVPPLVTAAISQAGPPPATGGRQTGWSTSATAGPAILSAAIDSAQAAAPALGQARVATAVGGSSGKTPVVTAHAAAIGLKPTLHAFTKAVAGDPSTIRVVASGQPAMLGPPSIQPGQPLDGRANFLREIWQVACGPFTTVLGPEANRAHRNHFHVDLAQRKSGAFCQ